MDTPDSIQAASVFIADCELGRGVFAARAFAAGEFILRFSGPLIDLERGSSLGDHEANPLQVSATEYMDLEQPGIFINHSCEPNTGVKDDAYSTMLVALRPLAIGEEIRWDYSTSMWEEIGPWTMPCRCGSAACRGVVDQFPTLPLEVQTRYLAQGIVMGFIADRLTKEKRR